MQLFLRLQLNHLCLFSGNLSVERQGQIAGLALQVKVPVCVFAFDCLFVDGKTLLKEPLETRRACMAAALPNMQPGFVCLAKSHRLQAQKAHTPPRMRRTSLALPRLPALRQRRRRMSMPAQQGPQ